MRPGATVLRSALKRFEYWAAETFCIGSQGLRDLNPGRFLALLAGQIGLGVDHDRQTLFCLAVKTLGPERSIHESDALAGEVLHASHDQSDAVSPHFTAMLR